MYKLFSSALSVISPNFSNVKPLLEFAALLVCSAVLTKRRSLELPSQQARRDLKSLWRFDWRLRKRLLLQSSFVWWVILRPESLAHKWTQTSMSLTYRLASFMMHRDLSRIYLHASLIILPAGVVSFTFRCSTAYSHLNKFSSKSLKTHMCTSAIQLKCL